MDDAAYISALIGRPWQRDGLHCWALVSRVEQDLFGRALPAGLKLVPPSKNSLMRAFVRGLAETEGWQEVLTPRHGAVALMHRSGAPVTALVHSGVWLDFDGGGVLHTDEPHGVVFDNAAGLRARNWVARWFIPIPKA